MFKTKIPVMGLINRLEARLRWRSNLVILCAQLHCNEIHMKPYRQYANIRILRDMHVPILACVHRSAAILFQNRGNGTANPNQTSRK